MSSFTAMSESLLVQKGTAAAAALGVPVLLPEKPTDVLQDDQPSVGVLGFVRMVAVALRVTASNSAGQDALARILMTPQPASLASTQLLDGGADGGADAISDASAGIPVVQIDKLLSGWSPNGL